VVNQWAKRYIFYPFLLILIFWGCTSIPQVEINLPDPVRSDLDISGDFTLFQRYERFLLNQDQAAFNSLMQQLNRVELTLIPIKSIFYSNESSEIILSAEGLERGDTIIIRSGISEQYAIIDDTNETRLPIKMPNGPTEFEVRVAVYFPNFDRIQEQWKNQIVEAIAEKEEGINLEIRQRAPILRTWILYEEQDRTGNPLQGSIGFDAFLREFSAAGWDTGGSNESFLANPNQTQKIDVNISIDSFKQEGDQYSIILHAQAIVLQAGAEYLFEEKVPLSGTNVNVLLSLGRRALAANLARIIISELP
jgi:hypothetical protein